MGQRLIITVKKNDADLCKIYYHWSAYTESAVEQAKELIEYLNENKNIDTRLACLRFVYSQGGQVRENDDDFAYTRELFPDEPLNHDGHRNHGLISFTDFGMDALQGWGEGDLIIDLDSREIINDVVYTYATLTELNEVLLDCGEPPITSEDDPRLFDVKYDITEFSFNDIDAVLDIIKNWSWQNFIVCGELYCQKIE